ncbi:hypothetical protein TB1_009276 [Malus domestica]
MAVARLSTSKVNLDSEPQGLYLRPHKAPFKLTMSFSFSTARRALPEESCLIKTCPTRLTRLNPIRKQKPDSSPQPAPTSQGSCVLVCQEVIPDGNSCEEQEVRITLPHI